MGLVLRVDEGQLKMLLREFLVAYRAAPREWRLRCRNIASDQFDSSVHLPQVAALHDNLAAQG